MGTDTSKHIKKSTHDDNPFRQHNYTPQHLTYRGVIKDVEAIKKQLSQSGAATSQTIHVNNKDLVAMWCEASHTQVQNLHVGAVFLRQKKVAKSAESIERKITEICRDVHFDMDYFAKH